MKAARIAAIALLVLALAGCKIEQKDPDDPATPDTKSCTTEFVSPFAAPRPWVWQEDPEKKIPAFILATRTVTTCDGQHIPKDHTVNISFQYAPSKGGPWTVLHSPIPLVNTGQCHITNNPIYITKKQQKGHNGWFGDVKGDVAYICDFSARVCKVGYWRADAFVVGTMPTTDGGLDFTDRRTSDTIHMDKCPKDLISVVRL